MWARAGPDGFVHDFEVYQGRASAKERTLAADNELNVSLSEAVVFRMLRTLATTAGSTFLETDISVDGD